MVVPCNKVARHEDSTAYVPHTTTIFRWERTWKTVHRHGDYHREDQMISVRRIAADAPRARGAAVGVTPSPGRPQREKGHHD
ncbi:hypothetical protein GCM10010156_53830 [Planobispora rosea]|uniref:Uncharacterized protein n=1 Tax=Planobispora rosea TaxID=35762 RepID=A0A8J3S632_PLARO|nr:hypothetical protein GCM10010156_53830 [Planobispora rosea]GIH86815.1 hypothetical protein Pro02_52230 [Planobispora rosea]